MWETQQVQHLACCCVDSLDLAAERRQMLHSFTSTSRREAFLASQLVSTVQILSPAPQVPGFQGFVAADERQRLKAPLLIRHCAGSSRWFPPAVASAAEHKENHQ